MTSEEEDDILYGVGHKQREALILAAMKAIGPKYRGELKAEWLRRVLAYARHMERAMPEGMKEFPTK